MRPENQLEIVPYDAQWPNAFETEAVRLRKALGPLALRIDHNGSTSIPDLAAKPIIDIQISVAVLQPIMGYGAPLRAIGYVHVPHLTTRSVHSSIGHLSGLISIMFTSSKMAAPKNGGRWSFGIIFANMATWLTSTSSSNETWPGNSRRAIANLVRPTPARRRTSSAGSLPSLGAADIPERVNWTTQMSRTSGDRAEQEE